MKRTTKELAQEGYIKVGNFVSVYDMYGKGKERRLYNRLNHSTVDVGEIVLREEEETEENICATSNQQAVPQILERKLVEQGKFYAKICTHKTRDKNHPYCNLMALHDGIVYCDSMIDLFKTNGGT